VEATPKGNRPPAAFTAAHVQVYSYWLKRLVCRDVRQMVITPLAPGADTLLHADTCFHNMTCLLLEANDARSQQEHIDRLKLIACVGYTLTDKRWM